MNRALRYLLLVPLSVAAFVVLLVLPDVDLGWLGGIALLAGSWLVWYLLWATWCESVADAQRGQGGVPMSPGEQRAWIGALFTAVILLFYALHGDAMVAPDGSRAPESADVGRHIGYLVVAWVVVMQVLRGYWRDRVEEDERDRAIQARATAWARNALVVFVIGIAVLFAFTPLERLQWAGPMVISNLLMAGVIGSCLLDYLVAGLSYWRDRRAMA